MVGVLPFVARLSFLQTRQPGTPHERRGLRILQVKDLNDYVAETRLSGCSVEVAGVGRPPALVRPEDELAATAATARVRRRAVGRGRR